jgi:hypothetical protein
MGSIVTTPGSSPRARPDETVLFAQGIAKTYRTGV